MSEINLPGRFSTVDDVVAEVEYQAAEYDLGESTAIENIADECGVPWGTVANIFWAAKGNI